MKRPSTLKVDALPDTTGCVLQRPVKFEQPTGGFVTWQFVSVLVWAYLGAVFDEYLPIPLTLVPGWAALRICWPLVVAAFALQFSRHYAAVCTATLPAEEAKRRRSAFARAAFLRIIALPVVLPWALLCCVAQAPELFGAWASWFCYNRQGAAGPGVMASPAGPQWWRVWQFRFCVVLVAAATRDLPWIDPAARGTAAFAAQAALAVVVVIPGALTVLVPSLVIALSQGALKEARRA